MFGWRARVGLIKPTHRGKSFAYWYKNAPEGVEIVPTFIGFRSEKRESFLEGFKRAEELAVQLKEVGCDIVSVSGTPPFLLKGLDFERQWAADLSRKIALPVVTPMEPHAIALQALGVRRVAVATYYGNELNQAIVEYFSRFGIASELMPGLSMSGEGSGLYTTSLRALDEVSYVDVYRHCKKALLKLPPVDGLYINGGGWDAAPAIEFLERDLHIKVVWALAAEMWFTYHLLKIDHRVPGGGGVLLSGNYAPAQ
jgi:maleate cis-trans isomerase